MLLQTLGFFFISGEPSRLRTSVGKDDKPVQRNNKPWVITMKMAGFITAIRMRNHLSCFTVEVFENDAVSLLLKPIAWRQRKEKGREKENILKLISARKGEKIDTQARFVWLSSSTRHCKLVQGE